MPLCRRRRKGGGIRAPILALGNLCGALLQLSEIIRRSAGIPHKCIFAFLPFPPTREIAYAYRVKYRSQFLVRDRRIPAAHNIVSHTQGILAGHSLEISGNFPDFCRLPCRILRRKNVATPQKTTYLRSAASEWSTQKGLACDR